MPRPAHDPPPRLNEAMPTGAAWATTQTSAGGRTFWPTWAPSLLPRRPGVATSSRTRCRTPPTGVAASRRRPARGRVGSLRRPLHPAAGLRDRAAIDPQYFRAKDGALWLLYKWAGTPDRLSVRRMLANATGWWPGSINYRLLVPRLPWEGHTVENPAMIRFKRRVYLFYSPTTTPPRATRPATPSADGGRAVPAQGPPALDRPGTWPAGRSDAVPRQARSAAARLPRLADRPRRLAEEQRCATTAAGCPQRRMYVATLAVRQAAASSVGSAVGSDRPDRRRPASLAR